MSIEDLQIWLMNEGIRDDLNTLIRTTVRTELDNLVPEPDAGPKCIDWSRLLLAGSILARSNLRSHQEAALRIATGAVTLCERESIKDAGAVLFGKLSNFRAVDLADARGLLAPDLEGRLGIALRMEAQHRRIDHAILVESSGRWLQVNDFQKRFWSKAAGHGWLSASAPTASGKTFLVLQWLLDQMRTNDVHVAVYLAPTRALVSEIERGIESLLGPKSSIEVLSLPLVEKYKSARAGGPAVIFVFTQERLHLLAGLLGDGIALDLLIVDEAHKIGDNQRGVILQDAIERVTRANRIVKVVFISAATQNPEELLADAPDGVEVAAVDSDVATVLQNLILAEQVPGRPKLWNLSIRQLDTTLPVGVLQLASSPSTLRKRIAFIAAAVGERGGTLVYANRASDAEEIADQIAQLVPIAGSPDPELIELADLARKGVHPKYTLALLVERGVAFHYGNMPSLIRLEVERLFKSGKIRFLVCTSTLIEGVNLACRTIVVRGPRKGLDHPMEPQDFWNLAGRAGRWGDEFEGNIICVDPGDTKAWPQGVPARARYEIKRETDAVIGSGTSLNEYLDRRARAETHESEGADRYDQVGAYLLATYLRFGSISHAGLTNRHSPSVVARLNESLATIAQQVELDSHMASRHPGVSVLGLQRLLEEFRNYKGNVENLLPVHVDSQDRYDRFVTIMRRINEHLFPAFLPDGLVRLYALIIVQWLEGSSLAKMIRENIAWHIKVKKPYKLPGLIRRTMELVEQIARFKAPRYFSAYVDVLNLHLRAISRSDLIEHDLDIGVQLEFGVSSRTLVSLMTLGLSRMSSVALYERMARDDLTQEDCLTWVRERDAQFDGMDIPAIVVREIREKLLPANGE